MQNLESRRESIERRKIIRMTKAIDLFIDGGQGYHDLSNLSSNEFGTSHAGDGSRHSDGPPQSKDRFLPHLPPEPAIAFSGAAEKAPIEESRREHNAVVSNAGGSAENETLDSEDKRERDLVYARASHLIREGLAMQGWWVRRSDYQHGLTIKQFIF